MNKKYIDIDVSMVQLLMYNHVFFQNVDEVQVNEMFEMNNMYNDIYYDDKLNLIMYAVFDNDDQ
jgi:hypothetical protein